MINKSEILNRIHQIPPMPQISRMILALVNNPRSSASDIVEIVRNDQALTANVLKLCNSAYFGLRRKIDSLSTAVVLIGHRHLVELVMISNCIHIFRGGHNGHMPAQNQLWMHSISTALLSQILLKRLGYPPDHAIYTAALLHDVGKIILHEHMGAKYGPVLDMATEQKVSYHSAERELLGTDHAEIGGYLMQAWNLPENIVDGIQSHHAPRSFFDPRDISSVVNLCDLICLKAGLGRDALDSDKESLSKVVGTQLTTDFVDSCVEELSTEIGKFDMSVFGFRGQAFKPEQTWARTGQAERTHSH